MDPENKKDDSHGHCVGGSPINDVDNLNNDIPSTSYDPRNSSRQRLAARLNFRYVKFQRYFALPIPVLNLPTSSYMAI